MHAAYKQITFTDRDVVNPDDFIPQNESNPHHIHPFLFHDHGFAVGVVFAEHLQDALDILADSGKIDGVRIADSELDDYGPEEEGISFLGNAGEPFDVDSLGVLELPNPPFSFCALFQAAQA